MVKLWIKMNCIQIAFSTTIYLEDRLDQSYKSYIDKSVSARIVKFLAIWSELRLLEGIGVVGENV